MSINFCTLTNSSVDTFCGNRRGIVLGNLLTQKYPPAVRGTNNSSIRDRFAQLRPDLVSRIEDDERQPMVYEQPLITVEVVLNGVRMEHTMEAEQRLDFVTVTNLLVRSSPKVEMQESIEPSAVSISDFNITQL